MPLPRFRIRTLMIAVAAVGLLAALVGRPIDLRQRYRYHRSKCQETFEDYLLYAKQSGALTYKTDANGLVGFPDIDHAWEARDAGAQRLLFIMGFHARLRDKYDWAYRHPWLPVDPDPPAPPNPPAPN